MGPPRNKSTYLLTYLPTYLPTFNRHMKPAWNRLCPQHSHSSEPSPKFSVAIWWANAFHLLLFPSQSALSGRAIGGLSLTAFISKHNNPEAPIKVNIYESRPEISMRGTGIGIWKCSWQVLQDLGINKELQNRNIAPPKDGEGMTSSHNLPSRIANSWTSITVSGLIFRKSD